MRKRVGLSAIAAAFAAMAQNLASAMPMPTGALATAASAISQVEKTGYYRYGDYYGPFGYYRPYAYYSYYGYPWPAPLYGVVPAYSYFDYYQTYGCSGPNSYCVYYNW